MWTKVLTQKARDRAKAGDPARQARRQAARAKSPSRTVGAFRAGGGFNPTKKPSDMRRGA